jgi:hypothetical protein
LYILDNSVRTIGISNDAAAWTFLLARHAKVLRKNDENFVRERKTMSTKVCGEAGNNESESARLFPTTRTFSLAAFHQNKSHRPCLFLEYFSISFYYVFFQSPKGREWVSP